MLTLCEADIIPRLGTMAESVAIDQYADIAAQYDGIEALPQSKLSESLVQFALGNCTGEVILDSMLAPALHHQCIPDVQQLEAVVDCTHAMQ